MSFLSLLGHYWESMAAFGLFGLLHSAGAQEPCKNALARWFSRFFVDHFWRITYCALSYAALYYGIAALHWARNPDNDVWLFVYPDWLWQVILVLHLSSIGLLYVAFLQSDYLEFLGLRQAARGPGVLVGGTGGRGEGDVFGPHRPDGPGVCGWSRSTWEGGVARWPPWGWRMRRRLNPWGIGRLAASTYTSCMSEDGSVTVPANPMW